MNWKKPNLCSCGFEIGGQSIPKTKTELHNNPLSVILYENTLGTLKPVKLISNDDRQFVFTNDSEKICYAKNWTLEAAIKHGTYWQNLHAKALRLK